MRPRAELTVASLSVVCLGLSLPLPANEQVAPRGHFQTAAASVSGEITTVGVAEIVLQSVTNHKRRELRFAITADTNVDGNLMIGAPATIDYRADKDGNTATYIRVLSVSASIGN